LTETAPGEGTYETSVANAFILDGLAGPPMGTRTGRYFLVGGLLMMTGQRTATPSLRRRPHDLAEQLRLGDGGADEVV